MHHAAAPARPYLVQEETLEEIPVKEPVITHRLGVVFNFNKKTYPYFTVDVVIGEADEKAQLFPGKVEKLDLTKYVNTDSFSEKDKQLIATLRKLQEQEINKYISRNSPFSGILGKYHSS